MTVVHLAQPATPLPGDPHRLPTGLRKPRGIAHQHAIGLSHMRLDVVPQRLSQGRIVPRTPADAALQGQAGLAKTLGNRCDILAFDIRHEATDSGCGVVLGGLSMEDCD